MSDDFLNDIHNHQESDSVRALVQAHQEKSVLRFITCGSVDDGKSTLIGRILFESNQIFDDQLDKLADLSKKHGTQGEQLDYALLLDGLAAEREQGITIDVAYRFFSTAKRKFIVADCPGHEQYTRNMATGASNADLAVVLVDARKGLLPQSFRHSFIVAMFGVRHVVLAVNKMDAVDYSQSVFDAIKQQYDQLAKQLGFLTALAIPVSALNGDNLIHKSAHMPWYQGKALLPTLESIELQVRPRSSGVSDNHAAIFQTPAEKSLGDFRMPVQWVARTLSASAKENNGFAARGLAGRIVSGQVQVGDQLKVQAQAASTSIVRQILRGQQSVLKAVAGDSVLLTLQDERDISRGDVLVPAQDQSQSADLLQVRLLWMHSDAAKVGQSYWLKLGSKTVNARITRLIKKLDITNPSANSSALDQAPEKVEPDQLALNEIAICELKLDVPIAAERFAQHQALGALVLIDRQQHATVAAGVIDELHNERQYIHPDRGVVSANERAQQKHQQPRVLWLTGISGAGKSTIANALDRQLTNLGRHCYVLDGDNLRAGLTKHLGFSEADRSENVRLAAETAKILLDAGILVIVSLISPFAKDRAAAKALFKEQEFVEVHVHASQAAAIARDPKGLYRKASAREVKSLTGFNAPYEVPAQPDLFLDTEAHSVEELVQLLQQRV